MITRRRLAVILALGAALALLVAAPALAGAGGGSSGFGGGGGGEGGHGGGGFFIWILFQLLFRLALLGHGLGALVIVALVLLWVMLGVVVPRTRAAYGEHATRGRAGRRRTAQRIRRVELAAAEAAEEDPAFAPDAALPAATALFKQIQAAWSADDRVALKRLVGPGLMAEWERRLDDFRHRGWRNRVELIGEPEVQYVGLQRRRGDDRGRITVRVQAMLRDYVVDAQGRRINRVGHLSERTRIREFWTLARTASGWMLLSIEQGAEGAHALGDQLVPTPWSDEQELRDEALVEGAAADAVPQGTRIAELADLSFEGDARAVALDLSLVDGRFAPDVLEVAVRRAVAAWADAVDGHDAALRALATPSAVADLLHPGDRTGATRVVVRGPSVKAIRIAGLHGAGTSAMMAVEVTITGRRYIEDRATAAVVAGNPTRQSTFLERWTFALQADPAQPWRIVAVDSAVAAR